jgi:hypothetical protein
MVCCDTCSRVFCEDVLSKLDLLEEVAAKAEWECFVCDPGPIKLLQGMLVWASSILLVLAFLTQQFFSHRPPEQLDSWMQEHPEAADDVQDSDSRDQELVDKLCELENNIDEALQRLEDDAVQEVRNEVNSELQAAELAIAETEEAFSARVEQEVQAYKMQWEEQLSTLQAQQAPLQELLDCAGINLPAVYAALEKSRDRFFVKSWEHAARVGDDEKDRHEEKEEKSEEEKRIETEAREERAEAAAGHKKSAEEELKEKNPLVMIKGQKRAKYSGAEGYNSRKRAQLTKVLAEAQTPKEAAALCAMRLKNRSEKDASKEEGDNESGDDEEEEELELVNEVEELMDPMEGVLDDDERRLVQLALDHEAEHGLTKEQHAGLMLVDEEEDMKKMARVRERELQRVGMRGNGSRAKAVVRRKKAAPTAGAGLSRGAMLAEEVQEDDEDEDEIDLDEGGGGGPSRGRKRGHRRRAGRLKHAPTGEQSKAGNEKSDVKAEGAGGAQVDEAEKEEEDVVSLVSDGEGGEGSDRERGGGAAAKRSKKKRANPVEGGEEEDAKTNKKKKKTAKEEEFAKAAKKKASKPKGGQRTLMSMFGKPKPKAATSDEEEEEGKDGENDDGGEEDDDEDDEFGLSDGTKKKKRKRQTKGKSSKKSGKSKKASSTVSAAADGNDGETETEKARRNIKRVLNDEELKPTTRQARTDEEKRQRMFRSGGTGGLVAGGIGLGDMGTHDKAAGAIANGHAGRLSVDDVDSTGALLLNPFLRDELFDADCINSDGTDGTGSAMDLSMENAGEGGSCAAANAPPGKRVYVHPELSAKLKKHQIEGIRFMWANLCGSVRSLQDGDAGLGCIVAHSMGLGKTLQVPRAFTSLSCCPPLLLPTSSSFQRLPPLPSNAFQRLLASYSSNALPPSLAPLSCPPLYVRPSCRRSSPSSTPSCGSTAHRIYRPLRMGSANQCSVLQWWSHRSTP